MIDKTERERAAIVATRQNLGEKLIELGLMDAFYNQSPEAIDSIIEACIDGFAEAMRDNRTETEKFLNDELPF